MTKTTAGQLRERFSFWKRVAVSDGAGNEEGVFVEQFTVAAAVRPLRGGEAVIASRLEGRQPIVLTVRQSSQTREIAADWQARNARTGEVYALRSPPVDPDGMRAFLDMLAMSGVAA